jgi:PIN domain nuclease of toxin-antitoxin system
MSAQLEIFSGWKQIANYLGKGVRSVQRYERELALPIHRPAGKSRAAVIATKSELDNWVTAGPVRVDLSPKRWLSARTNRIGAEFLQVDSEIALTFCGLALQARDEAARKHRAQIARKAYDTITRLRKGIDLNEEEMDKLETNLQRLRNELQSLGQTF